MPTIYVIAGPNGAGKTTFARVFLPRYAGCVRFVNPDLIAAGLSPFDPPAAAARAARLVLEQIREHLAAGVDFAFETTLSGRTYLPLLRRAKGAGYRVVLIYLWLPDPALAVARVADRVAQGGHDVPERDIRRRFGRSLRHLCVDYGAAADEVLCFDNSGERPHLVFRAAEGVTTVHDAELYRALMEAAV